MLQVQEKDLYTPKPPVQGTLGYFMRLSQLWSNVHVPRGLTKASSTA